MIHLIETAGIDRAMRLTSIREANSICASLIRSGHLAESHRIPRIGSDRFGIAIWLRTNPDSEWRREWLVRFHCIASVKETSDD